jgi:hypothetical protein
MLRKSLVEKIPHVGAEHAAGLGHAFEFGDRFVGIGHEGDNQRHRAGVELAVGEWQRLRIANLEIHAFRDGRGSGIGDLLLRGVDALTWRGAQRSNRSCVKAPVPQPTSTQERPGGTDIQSRKTSPSARVKRPISRSYASPSMKKLLPFVIQISRRRGVIYALGKSAKSR